MMIGFADACLEHRKIEGRNFERKRDQMETKAVGGQKVKSHTALASYIAEVPTPLAPACIRTER